MECLIYVQHCVVDLSSSASGRFSAFGGFASASYGDQTNVLYANQVSALAPYTVFTALKHLQLIKGSSAAVRRVLEGLPALEDLTLVMFEMEMAVQPFQELCPNLIRLSIAGRRTVPQFSETDIRDMVVCRMQREGFAPLQRLDVSLIAVAENAESFQWLHSLGGLEYIRSVPKG